MTTSTPVDPRRALILGVGPGLGASIARRFGREGFAVTLVARREQPLVDLADTLRSAGISADTATADAYDLQGFRTRLEVLARDVAPGVVVYNAALIARDRILTSETDHLLSAYAIDVLGAVIAAQVFTPAMRQAHAGTFLVSGGSPGVLPQPDYATLSLGKAALRAAMALMHEDLKADGVHSSGVTIGGAIAPGTAFDPDRIADTYWGLHAQPLSEWAAETAFDGR